MKVDTKYFGEIEIGDEKIVHFDNGILGFEDYKDYTILYDIESEGRSFFSWLQSIDEKALAFPIVNPFKADENYNPHVNDEMLKPIGSYTEEDLVIFLLATIPADVKETSVNMRAPLIINAATRKGIQLILDSPEYEIKHKLIKQ
ncbi:MAG TPA: flagellar assembly protein FliW [Lachnospiraceae bacterium]|nr:flagellar assembly protein FliW [Lachnospiraceae bacterium]